MANPNPIQTHYPSKYTDFTIDRKHQGKTLRLSTTIKLSNEKGWKYSELNDVMVAGQSYDPTPTKPLNKLPLEKTGELDGKKVAIRTIVITAQSLASLNDAGAAAAISVNYTLDVFADEEQIESFSLDNGDHPASFFTKIQIKVQ